MAKLVAAQQFSIHTDYLGTPVLMADAQSQAVWGTQYSVYGELRSLNGARHACPFRWPGQYEDAETGLYYNRFRYYDAEAGQYVAQDPIGLAGGLGLHAYVHDPLAWVDPLGLSGECLKTSQKRKLRDIEELAQTPGEKGLKAAVTRRESDQLGRAFVGPAHRIARGEMKGEVRFISADGKRMYRSPTDKGSSFARTGRQANFHQKNSPNANWFDP